MMFVNLAALIGRFAISFPSWIMLNTPYGVGSSLDALALVIRTTLGSSPNILDASAILSADFET